MEGFQFGEALRQIHDFLWGEFCDWYVELAKIRLRSRKGVISPIPILVSVLETSLRLLHPFMPFVTEELWQNLKSRLPSDWQSIESIMVATYPEAEDTAIDSEAERVMESVTEIIRSIRNARAQYKVENSRWVEALISGGELTPSLTQYASAIEVMARARPVVFLKDRRSVQAADNTLALVLTEAEVFIPMASMFDFIADFKFYYGL